MASARPVSAADFALKGAAGFWLLAALAGQWAFFYYIAAFYGPSTFSGNFEAWNRLVALGQKPFIAGDTGGNLAFAMHALGAGIVALGGALQLIPKIRAWAPTFHRWNGRVFLLTVIGLSLSGFFLVWVRRTSPSLVEAIATTLNGVLILTFAMRTYVTARARDFAVHRRWAMRLYLVSNAQWFLRVGFFSYFVVGQLVGYEPGFGDPFLHFWTWGCYLVPLLVLEIYLRTRERAGSFGRFAVAGGLVALTLVMTAGVAGFAMFSQMIISGRPLAFP